jgi:hypothetical protein
MNENNDSKKCIYCNKGYYQIYIDERMHTDSHDENNLMKNPQYMDRIKEFGFPMNMSNVWEVNICDNCGNVQIFRGDWKKRY